MSYPMNSHFERGSGVVDLAQHRVVAGHGAMSTRHAPERQYVEIAVITHELRNSLAVIRNAARALRAVPSLDGARALIERHVGHMSRQLEELLEPRRRNGQVPGASFSTIDLRTIVRYATDAITPEMALRRHGLLVQLPEAPVWVHADAALLEQMLSNLLINAAKYTPDGGNIAVFMEPEQQRVRLRVRDSGVGIETSLLPSVFDMFMQIGTSMTTLEDGHGIGLAVVRTIVEQHGGSVTATSAGLGQGSEFTVILPTLRGQHDPGIVLP